MYKPEPVDTRDVALSEDLLALTELIAKNVHDVWAQSRIREGWTYGENRDNVAKTTPCLVPYEELPEIEKEYDRNTAFETIRLIKAKGGNPEIWVSNNIPGCDEHNKPIHDKYRKRIHHLYPVW